MAQQTTNRPAPKNTSASTQRYLDIQEIRDDVVIMKDATLRAVVLVSSINFDLKSEDEQIAIIQSYTQFLNALEFPLQIIIQSRKFDIDEYLERLKTIEKQQTNDLLRLQTAEYRQYISELVELADLMSKRFYVVIPYSSQEKKNRGFLTKVRDLLSPTGVLRLKQDQFVQYKSELFKRVDFVMEGLAGVGGLKSVVLDTQGLIELFYATYNPQTSGQQPLAQMKELNIT
ncbi:MAG: hypothetical protein V1778_02490 [bacterium]